jgi:acyl-CoA reductase-like NAD-dependent aldehyde dehydrogenase
MFKKLSLELGGKNPNLIFADCDYEKMLAVTVKSSFANQGQICLCGSRIYVEESIAEQFKKDFVAKTEEIIIGDPLILTTTAKLNFRRAAKAATARMERRDDASHSMVASRMAG